MMLMDHLEQEISPKQSSNAHAHTHTHDAGLTGSCCIYTAMIPGMVAATFKHGSHGSKEVDPAGGQALDASCLPKSSWSSSFIP